MPVSITGRTIFGCGVRADGIFQTRADSTLNRMAEAVMGTLRGPRGNDSAKHPAFFLAREVFDSSPIKKGLYGGGLQMKAAFDEV